MAALGTGEEIRIRGATVGRFFFPWLDRAYSLHAPLGKSPKPVVNAEGHHRQFAGDSPDGHRDEAKE